VDDGSHKGRLLDHFLRDVDLDQAIVFTATKRGADRLASKLYEEGHAAAALHGDMNQSQRNRTIAKMRSGNVRVLVATDVAARGIDVKTISHVINYDLPKMAEDYVHRIGRTGRAGANGIAISFAAPDDGWQVRQIERYTGHAIVAHVVEGLEPKVQQRSSHKPSSRPGKGGKRGNGGGYAGRGAGGGGRWSKPASAPAASRGKPERSYSSFRGR
jgi:superfamily II DNA/RNA helicase